MFAPEKLRSFSVSGVNLTGRAVTMTTGRTPSYIFVFPTIRSRSDLQTSCSECTRRRWLRGSIAQRALTGRRSSRRMFIRALARSTSTLSTTLLRPYRRAPTAVQRALGQTDGELQIRANRRNTIVILSRASRMLQRLCT